MPRQQGQYARAQCLGVAVQPKAYVRVGVLVAQEEPAVEVRCEVAEQRGQAGGEQFVVCFGHRVQLREEPVLAGKGVRAGAGALAGSRRRGPSECGPSECGPGRWEARSRPGLRQVAAEQRHHHLRAVPVGPAEPPPVGRRVLEEREPPLRDLVAEQRAVPGVGEVDAVHPVPLDDLYAVGDAVALAPLPHGLVPPRRVAPGLPRGVAHPPVRQPAPGQDGDLAEGDAGQFRQRLQPVPVPAGPGPGAAVDDVHEEPYDAGGLAVEGHHVRDDGQHAPPGSGQGQPHAPLVHAHPQGAPVDTARITVFLFRLF